MYIQQECLFSFEEILKFQPKSKLEIILAELDFENLISELSKSHTSCGPKGYSIRAMLNAFIAMQVERIPTLTDLSEKLKTNPILRYSCGFSVLEKTPSTPTISRFLQKISCNNALEKEFYNIVEKAISLGIIDGTEVAIDATKIDAYEKAQPTKKLNNDGISANWGSKNDTDGNKIKWFGYKLHILCDCKSELPLSILLTPASYYDGELARPLIKKYLQQYSGVLNTKYYLMDSGYDQNKNYEYIANTVKATPIIAYNKRGEYAPPEGVNENFEPICSMGYPLVYWGKDGDYLKYRCPSTVGKVECPQGTCWCTNSNYGYCKKINSLKNMRLFSYPPRHSKNFTLLYNKRTSVERCNSRLKELLNTDNLRSAGILKAKAIALLNCIALIAGTIAINIVKNNKLSVA
ncbi:transposase [Clostridium butyricum]|uniref:transposase n=1 Tax=Clostridium butyricum TaxID=1492 RepID=UPI0028FE83A9|nr:transposase [Clostridium butyricum]